MNVFRVGPAEERALLAPARRWLAHRDAIFDLCWTAEDRRLLTGSGDYHVCCWDTETTGLLATFRGHVGSVKTLCCHNGDPHVFASAGRDGHIMLWDVRVAEKSNDFGVAVKAPVMRIEGAHVLRRSGNSGQRSPGPVAVAEGGGGGGGGGFSGAKSVTGLLFALDDTMLVSSGADGRIKYWDVRKVSYQNPMGPNHSNASSVVDFEVKKNMQRSNQSRLPFGDVALAPRPHGITCIALDPFGSRLAAYSLDNHIYEYDFYAPEDLLTTRCFDAPVSSFYAKAAYSPSGHFLVAGSSSMNAGIYDVNAARAEDHRTVLGPLSRLEGHSQSVFAVDWSASDNQIATCSDDGTTRLWSVQPNRPQVKKRRLEEEDIAPEEEARILAAPPVVAPPPSAPAPARPRGPVQIQISKYFRPL